MNTTKHGFKVTLNSKPICRAGFENENSVLTCILTSSFLKNQNRNELDLSVSGLNSDTKQSANWFIGNLKKGDKIELEVITEGFEVPKTIKKPISEEEIIQKKIRQYNKLKEELKDHL
jgi:hypothetical protein